MLSGKRDEDILQGGANFLNALQCDLMICEILLYLGDCAIRIANDQVQSVAEYGGVQNVRSRLQGFDGWSERFAFHQKQLALHRFLFEFRGRPQVYHLAAKDQWQPIAVLCLLLVVSGVEEDEYMTSRALDYIPALA